MKERPLKHSDSFWGDLANAIALRPVYRRPMEAPQATKSVTLQPTAESAESTAQRKAEEKATTAVQHEAREETTTAETTAPLYRYLQEEQERSFAPTPVQQEQNPEPSVLVIDGEEYVSVNGINISRSTIDRLLAKGAGTTAPPQENRGPAEGTAVVVKEAGSQRNESPVSPFQGRILDASEVLALSEAAKHLPAQMVSKVILPSGVEIHQKVTNTNKSSVQRRVPVRATIRVSRARRLLNRKEKLKAGDLKRMGFQERQAIVLQGLYEARGIRSIASRLRTKPVNVIHTVQQLMGKFDVSTADDLLDKVWTMHNATRLLTPVETTALAAVLGHGTTLDATVIVHGQSVAPKPVDLNIPEGHPDHPSNDPESVGVKWKEWEKEKGKRTPAHSKATPSPRKPSDP